MFHFQTNDEINNIILKEAPSIDSISFANRWRYLSYNSNYKVAFVINGLYKKTGETLVLYQSDFFFNPPWILKAVCTYTLYTLIRHTIIANSEFSNAIYPIMM